MHNDQLPCPSCTTGNEVQSQMGALVASVAELNRTVVDLRVAAAESSVHIKQITEELKSAMVEINSLQSLADQQKGEKAIIATASVIVGGLITTFVGWWLGKQ